MKETRDTVLIVDDMEINRAILRGVLEHEYQILEAENGEQAMRLLGQHRGSIAVVLLDVVMPVMNGYQVLEEMGAWGFLHEIPVVMVTAVGSAESEVRAFALGASDIVMKPFEPHVVKRRVENIVELVSHKLHLEERVEEQARSLQESNEVITDALSSVIEYRSMESWQHILRIRMFTRILLQNVARTCREYDLDERRMDIITRAAALHDIGKIAIPDSILNKPGPLTKEEFEIMKTHTVKGCEMLEGFDRLNDREYLRYAYNICRCHHERWDGRGYPDGLKGDNIPICAQVVGIADVYDALTTDRVYKKAYPHEKAVTMILGGECGTFSPKLLECFKRIQGQFRELAREYADGRSPRADFAARHTVGREDEAAEAVQLTQTKYFSLLRYVDAPVMEVDLDSDHCHMVYLPNADFDLLRRGGGFLETFHGFIRGSVHPADRKLVEEQLEEYFGRFFADGYMKCSREYRIYHRSTGDYHWYRATALRIDTDSPRAHRAIIVWRDLGSADAARRRGQEAACADEVLSRNIPGGVLKHRNDARFTLTRVNEGFTAMLGYTRKDVEERCGGSFLALLHPDDRKQAVRQIRDQLSRGGIVEVEYRLLRRDGSMLWVLDKSKLVEEDGEEFLYGVLVDVTQTKQDQEELRLTLERHQIIMDQTNDIIFEWDMDADQFTYSQNWEKKFGYQPVNERPGEQSAASHIHPDDTYRFVELLRKLTSGIPYVETEYRIAKGDGRYLWCKVRATAQFDAAGRPVKAVGVILDVDDEKNRAELLQARAEQDALTKLFNKSAGRQRVERYLERRTPNSLGAMLIVDVDNFKQVNDRYGHMFGDAVLTQISERVRGLFRGSDIIARIGGDEFMVFLPQLSNRAAAADRAGKIIQAFQGIFRDKLEDCRLSCSIGMSYAPEHGVCFQDLFQRADRALYQAKSRGKSRFEVYDRKTMDQDFGDLAHGPSSALGARIDSDEAVPLGAQGLVRFAFQTLYRSGDMEEAVSTILAAVGAQFGVSRAYVFENAEDGRSCTNTFEWCNKGVKSQKDSLADISCQDGMGRPYADCFNENGIFYCRDIAELPPKQYELLAREGVKSLLQCAIRDNGRFCGFLGFDENEEARFWTQEQIDALVFISELLSVFLLKMRAQERTEMTLEGLLMALDNQNSWIYIIDPDTCEMHFLNAKTRALAPAARAGMKCYEAFYGGRAQPCAQCPARGIRKAKNQTLEVYNPLFNVWALADASLIKWEGREACLLTCHDLTPYKGKTRTEK